MGVRFHGVDVQGYRLGLVWCTAEQLSTMDLTAGYTIHVMVVLVSQTKQKEM